MTRGKQKNAFVNDFFSEKSTRGKGGKRGGRSAAQLYDEDASGEGGSTRGRGNKRGQLFQINYERRYDDLVHSEQAFQSEMLNSMNPRSSVTKRKGSKRCGGAGYYGHKSKVIDEELSRPTTSELNKNQRLKESGVQLYNTTIYDVMDGMSVPAHEVSVMDATPEVVLPATEGRAEVWLDRRGNQGNPITECNTWGLGYVKDQTSVKSAEKMSEETLRPLEVAGCSGESVHSVSELKSGPVGDAGELPGACEEKLGQPMLTTEKMDKSAGKRTVQGRKQRKKGESSRGFLSIGGLKVYTTDLSDMSDEDDSCTEQMQEGFAEEDHDYIGCDRKFERGNKWNKHRIARKKKLASPDPARFSGIMLDSSDDEESFESSDTDISDKLVDDYLTNCEGLSSDINNPNWVSQKKKSLEQTLIDEMDSESSEELDSDEESDDSAANSELEDDLKHTYKITAGSFGRQVTRNRRTEETSLHGDSDSDVEIEDLEQTVFFGYDSDSSGSEEDTLLSDDEARIRDLELDDEARIRGLELHDCTGGAVELNRTPKYRSVGGLISGPIEEVQFTTSIATQTWPISTSKRVKKSKGVPGQKKTERKESIAIKRRARAVNRGFDIVAVNKALEEMVRLKKDIIAFQPMEQRDRAQVHRLANMYRLKSSSQGTNKRRFVVVSITSKTGMPSAEDKIRLFKILGQVSPRNVESTSTSSRSLTGEEQRKASKLRRAERQALKDFETPMRKKSGKFRYFSTPTGKTRKAKGRSGEKSKDSSGKAAGQGSHGKNSGKKGTKNSVSYANNPVSFIARGLEGEEACIIPPLSARIASSAAVMEEVVRPRSAKTGGDSIESSYVLKSSVTEFAVFEAHTNGFASRMMAKMGYVEGHGLGRDKQGIAQPVEAVKRPKSLGLGAHANH